MTVYQSLALLDDPEYQDYLFLPFKDETNGKDTYGGGRYLDLRIPQNDELIIDFNKAYHPFCAYNATDTVAQLFLRYNWLQLPIDSSVEIPDIWFEH